MKMSKSRNRPAAPPSEKLLWSSAYIASATTIILQAYGINWQTAVYLIATAPTLFLSPPLSIFYIASLLAFHTPLIATSPLNLTPTVLLTLLLDHELRHHRKVLAWRMGYGAAVELTTLSLQAMMASLGIYPFLALLPVLTHLVSTAAYEASLQRKVTVVSPKTLTLHPREEKTVEIEVYAPRNVIVLPHPRFKHRARKREKSITLTLRIRKDKLGNHVEKVELLVSGKRKVIAVVRTVLIDVKVVPRLPEALRAIRRIALRLSEIEDVREALESGAKINAASRGAVYSLREYLPGDNPRDIQFKKSVSRQRLVVKEYSVQHRAWIDLAEKITEQPVTNIVFYADLTARTPEELDTLGYKALGIFARMIQAGIFPSALVLVEGDDVVFAAANARTPGQILRLAKEIASIKPLKMYMPPTAKAPPQPEMPPVIKHVVLQKYARWRPRLRLLKLLKRVGEAETTVLIYRPRWRRNRMYALLREELQKRGLYVQEITEEARTPRALS